jgi:hypothetical protein
VQAGGAGSIEPRLEALRRMAGLGSTQSERYHAVVSALNRDVGDEVGERQVRVERHGATRDIEDPAQLDSELAEDALAAARQPLEEGLAGPGIDLRARRKGHLRVADVLAGELRPQLVRDQLEVGRLDEASAQRGEDIHEVREVAELEPVAQALDVVHRQPEVMTPGKLQQRRRLDGSLEVQVELRFGCGGNKSVDSWIGRVHADVPPSISTAVSPTRHSQNLFLGCAEACWTSRT